MRTLDERILKILHELPMHPPFGFSWITFALVTLNKSLPCLDDYTWSSDTALRSAVFECIRCLIACMIIDDILLPPEYSADYKKRIANIFENKHKDEIKQCVREYTKLRASEIEDAYKEFKERVLLNKHALVLDASYCDPEKAEAFIEKCKAERLTN